MALNGSWEQDYRALACFTNLKHIYWAFRYMNRLNMYWTPPEHLWVQMNANEWVGTASEHPLTVHECHWVSMSMHGLCTNAIESSLKLNTTHHGVTMKKISFVSELITPWMLVSACEFLWVSFEHPLITCEFAWTPLSEYWTHPECLLVCMNANSEWEHPLSTLWVTPRIVNLTNL